MNRNLAATMPITGDIGGSFNAATTDADYDVVRKMYETIGIREFTEFVGQ